MHLRRRGERAPFKPAHHTSRLTAPMSVAKRLTKAVGRRKAMEPPVGRSLYLLIFAASFAFVACCEVINCCFLLLASLVRDCFCDACF